MCEHGVLNTRPVGLQLLPVIIFCQIIKDQWEVQEVHKGFKEMTSSNSLNATSIKYI